MTGIHSTSSGHPDSSSPTSTGLQAVVAGSEPLLPSEITFLNRITEVAFEEFELRGTLAEFAEGVLPFAGGQPVGVLVRNHTEGWYCLLHGGGVGSKRVLEGLEARLMGLGEQMAGRRIGRQEVSVLRIGEGEEVGENGEESLGEYVPLGVSTGEKSYGVLLVKADRGGEASPFLKQAARTLANILRALEHIRSLVITEPLTGCYNRRVADVLLAQLLEESVTGGRSFSLMLFDVDHFKQLNDIHGHRVGDDCLVAVVRMVREMLRTEDTLIRWGGDEFLLILPEMEEFEVKGVAKRMHERVRMELRIVGSRNVKISLSSGLVTFLPGREDLGLDELLEQADRALYESKRKGRDQYTFWQEDAGVEDLVALPLLGRTPAGEEELGEERSKAYQGTMDVLVAIMDAREFETSLHGRRVMKLTELLLDRLEITGKERRDILYGAMLHDIGKIAIPDHIFHKTTPLTESEWQVIRCHPEIGYRFVQSNPLFHRAGEIILFHHEAFDGKGYPRGLKGEEIPLGARLVAPLDAYDSMRAYRVYQRSMTREEAVEEIRVNAGRQFDPRVVEMLLPLISEMEKLGHWEV